MIFAVLDVTFSACCRQYVLQFSILYISCSLYSFYGATRAIKVCLVTLIQPMHILQISDKKILRPLLGMFCLFFPRRKLGLFIFKPPTNTHRFSPKFVVRGTWYESSCGQRLNYCVKLYIHLYSPSNGSNTHTCNMCSLQ